MKYFPIENDKPVEPESQAEPIEPEPEKPDANAGKGGSYRRESPTGERVLVSRTK